MAKELLITVLILKSTVCGGKDLFAGKTVDLPIADARLLISLGKAKKVQDEVDVEIDEDTTTALEDMKKNDLVEYAASLGIDVPSKATKEQIIELINQED